METLPEVPEDETEDGVGDGTENGNMGTETTGNDDELKKPPLENGSMGTESTGIEDGLRKLTMNKSASQTQLGSQQRTVDLSGVRKETTNPERTNEQPPQLSSDVSQDEQPLSENTTPPVSVPSTPQKEDDVKSATSSYATPTKKLNDSASSDQLRQLLLSTSPAAGRSTSPGLITGSSPLDDGEALRENSSSPVRPPEEPKVSTADAQVS